MTSSVETHFDQPEAGEHPAGVAYRSRIDVLQRKERVLQGEHIRLGYVRLAFGIAVVILLFPPIPPVLIAVLAFVLAARIHQKVLATLAETRRAIAFYEHGLARVQDRWAGLHPRQTRLDLTQSLYASDLDVFGPGSLFELLCTSRTSVGEDTLAGWLLTPGSIEDVTRRQQAVGDLRDRLAFREFFAAAPGPAIAALDKQALASWGGAPGSGLPQAFRWLAPLLVLLTMGAAWRYATANTPILLIFMLLVDVGLTFFYKRAFESVFVDAERASRSLRTLGVLLGSIERECFTADMLLALQARLQGKNLSASRAVGTLAGLVQWSEARSNYVVRILDAPFLYSLQLALALQRWRSRFGAELGSWLETLGELEALQSLAGYSFEHPADPFPLLLDGAPCFAATGLGHPLLPERKCVRNDASLGDDAQLLLVSGSNMSGKSTLLRSVGTNAVLAYAGAPVRAHTLSLSFLTLAASIQVSDSLQAGRSRFYAEILRLRSITEAARTRGPVLFLIDEVLAGTNSSDRLAGARGLVIDLLRHGAVGLMSTHDLALTAVSAGTEKITRNIHFEDAVVDGELQFDYKLREGVVERSNGLALMRLIGLDV